MNQQEILRKIGGIIVELKEQHIYLQANSSSFNDFELELFMANANFLTDHIEILKKIYGNAKSTSASPVLPFEQVTPTKPVIPDYFSEEEHLPFTEDLLLKKLDDFSAIKGPELEQAEQEPAQTSEEKKPALFTIADTSFTAQKSLSIEKEEVEEKFSPEPEKLEPIAKEKAVPDLQESLQPEPIIFEEQPKPIIAEPEIPKLVLAKPKHVKPEPEPALTLNQQIAAQRGLDQLKANPVVANKAVQDLPSLITLNNKLLFVKELFNGYNLSYTEAINILNRYTNFEQAEQFLKANYAGKNNWKDKPATAERFFDLLRQRFG